ncbi:MAG: hypothetical protein ACM3KR_00580 [Deltaproteobacteria bacterium]
MKVKLQIMIEETLKNEFIKACERVGLDMSEVIRMKIYEFTKENNFYNIETTIEHLQEMGKVVVNDTKNINELQYELQKRGYITEYKSTDRDYLILIENMNIDKPKEGK